ncbi:outer membrane protein [Microvirga solisilvae]|uniref:outer membrane protein n=1 Tax=Microvirga solisilvae TaxID=2919498 RepID=UPI001FAFEFB6|nr:outer membrane protein [Microvirga solisilvae]
MSFIKTTVLAGVIGITASAASAADLPRRLFMPAAPVLVDTRDSWYLRGDVGYAHYKRPEADYTSGLISGSMSREHIGDNAVVGVGIGYRFSPMFRADVTVDHRFHSRFKGLPADGGFATGSVSDRARFETSTAMFNTYADLGTYRGITPYVGAGIGVAHNIISDYTRTTDALGVITQERLAGGDDYNFAWALMAGVGYKLSNSFTLDLGYRYLSLGDVKTRGYADGAGADVESVGTHEVRFGVRYAFQ